MEESKKNDDDPTLLSEDRLKTLSRNIKTLVPNESASELNAHEINSFKHLIEEVFSTACKPGLPTTHQVAAWNVLCGLIDQCVNSNLFEVQGIVWGERLWVRSFDLYLSQGHDARPKSAKQLLGTLSSALKSSPTRGETIALISQRLVSGISDHDEPVQRKPCLQALAFFLGREVISLTDVLATVNDETSNYASDGTLSLLLGTLFECAAEADLGSTVGQLLTVILDRADQTGVKPANHDLPVWLQPLEDSIQDDNMQFDEFRYHVLPALLKRSLGDYLTFLNRHGLQELVIGTPPKDAETNSQQSVSVNLLQQSLLVGKELGLLYETESSEMTVTNTSVLLPIRCIDRLLYANDRDARLAGLSLLITSRSATKLLPSQTFKILKRRISSFFADTDANFRSEIVSLIQRLVDRIRAATAVLARQAKADSTSSTILLEHKSFLKWLIGFLSWELRPTASYQRHISALKTLLVVVKSGIDNAIPTEFWSKSALNETKWPFSISVMTTGLRRQLMDLLMDPFDDVRQTSAANLSIYAASYNLSERESAIEELISGYQKPSSIMERAQAMMRPSGRADHADGVAHLQSLLFAIAQDEPIVYGPRRIARSGLPTHLCSRIGTASGQVRTLTRMLAVAKKSLAQAAGGSPIHGVVTGIRYTLLQDQSAFRSEVTSLIDCLHQIWETVKPILCNDAPEGYVPDDMEEVQDLTTKDTLSYCWRALKESSLLLGVSVNSKLLTSDQILDLSDLCFTQLAELRHRGAFSTVAQTWIMCCTRCKDLKFSEQNALSHWYKQITGSIQSDSTINTRRSAGLPSLICGLLIADKSGGSTVRAIKDLTDIVRQPLAQGSTQEASLPQVHALNCIKDILKSTRLSEHSERFISHAFLLAADSIQSEAWAVRNCGLMLFRAAIDRLLGTSESHLDDRVRYQHKISLVKQPEILHTIFELLRPENDTRLDSLFGNEGVFTALQLLQRVQIPHLKREEAIAAVQRLTGSRSWHVRDKAARTFASVVDEEIVGSELQRLLETPPPGLNAQHGALLCAKYLVARLHRASPSSPETRPPHRRIDDDGSGAETRDHVHNSIREARHWYFDSSCPLIKAAFINIILAHLRATNHSYRTTPFDIHVLDAINVSEELDLTLTHSIHGPGKGLLARTLAQTLAHELVLQDFSADSDVLSLLRNLAENDADACVAFFKELRHMPALRTCTSQRALCTLCAFPNILGSEYCMELKCEFQRFLLHLAQNDTQNEPSGIESYEFMLVFLNTCESASRPDSRESNSTYADRWLQLEAVKSELHSGSDDYWSEKQTQMMSRFASFCRMAIQDEKSSFFGREAAALAMGRLDNVWHWLTATHSTVLLDACICVYDLLNDDDEDIRQRAAEIASRILNAESGSSRTTLVCEPITAQQRLISFMLGRWSSESRFAEEAIARAFDIRLSNPVKPVDFQEAANTATDTALFVEEKQNVYIDEAREAKLWAQVVSTLSPTAIPRKLLTRLIHWVSNGLDEMDIALEVEADAPLMWRSKPAAFVLGLQVIYGAEAVLRLVYKGARVPISPSEMRMKLAAVVNPGGKDRNQPLWAMEAERVMSSVIREELSLRRRVMGCLVDRDTQ